MFKNHFSVYKKWCGYLEKNFNTWLSVWLVWVGRLIKLQIWTGYWKYWGRINDFQALECPLIWVLFRLQGIKLSLDLKFLQPWREQAHCLDSAATSLNPWLSVGRGQRRGNCWTWLLSVWTSGPQSLNLKCVSQQETRWQVNSPAQVEGPEEQEKDVENTWFLSSCSQGRLV